jgi:signal transduction histidine kinase
MKEADSRATERTNPVYTAAKSSNNDTDVEAGPNDRPGSSEAGASSKDGRSCYKLLSSRTMLFTFVMLILGGAAAAAFITVGITAAMRKQDDLFDRRAAEIVNGIETSWKSYEAAGLYVHQAARSGNMTRKEFRELYEYVTSTGLVFQVTSYNPRTTTIERAALEEESRKYYEENYPDLVPNYQGIVGLEPNDPDNSSAGLSVQPRSQQPYYFPVHLLEPIPGNVGAIDFDLYSSSSRRETINMAFDTWLPALTPPLKLVQETENAYSVILVHPGVPLSTTPDLRPHEFSSMVIRIPDLLRDAAKPQAEPTTVYIFDSTNETAPALFLGGATVTSDGELHFKEETTLEEVRRQASKQREITIEIASSKWTVAVVPVDSTYEADNTFIILGGVAIVAACVCLAVWTGTTMRRQAIQAQTKQKAEAEKAALIVDSAREAARSERELNDFIAHEVRNPLSAAMSACSFIASALTNETQPLTNGKSGNKNLESVLEDNHIIASSLQFINDLLRNMLDMQRASTNQLVIEMSPTDLLLDVFMSVDAMLYRRGSNFEVQTECPHNLIITTDRLRLKQMVLNLARNSLKFVEKGFIRLRAVIIDNKVHIYIEDSGPGIPLAKRRHLFAKFQESLDSLNQGTGIGLSLCKKLSALMGAEIWCDETYDSGILGCPGTRFIINLNVSPLQFDEQEWDKLNAPEESPVFANATPAAGTNNMAKDKSNSIQSNEPLPLKKDDKGDELPETLSVLFVDDDLVLRKLFCRAVRQVAPGWKVQEAPNGESALRLVDDTDNDAQQYDIIFMDQYMTSVEKQLLGTETTVALRAKGVKSTICGLSANDIQQAFLDAGANYFMMKPFPCGKEALRKELVRVVLSGDRLPIVVVEGQH